MRNFLLTIQYDGRGFCGWQIQKNGVTVQEVLQNALSEVLGEYSDLKGCSRTDSGVHANMYCVSVKTDHPIPAERLKPAINRYLPMSVVCLDSREVSPDFHARYDCRGKQYIYKIWNSDTRNPFLDGYALYYRYNIDVDVLNRAAQAYVGAHDFTSFCTRDEREQKNMVRTVRQFKVEREENLVTMTVEADGFLYNMVRIMVGTLLEICQGRLSPDSIGAIIEEKNRELAGATAPACGLYLNKVYY